MRSLPVRWLLFPSYIVLAALTLVLSGYFLFRLLSDFLYRETEEDVAARTELVATALEGIPLDAPSSELDSRVAKLSDGTNRITVIRADGIVIADTHANAPSMDNHAERPEVRGALRGIPTSARRFSHTVQQEMMVHAIPVGRDSAGRPQAVVRVGEPLSHVEEALSTSRRRGFAGAAIAAFVAALVGWFVARWFARPLEQMQFAAERYASGDLTFRVGPLLSAEGQRLRLALNNMAGDLDARIKDLARRNREQSALFRSMSEGVIAVDHQGRVLSINPSARELFRVTLDVTEGRKLPEVIRHSQLLSILDDTLASSDVLESELVLHEDQDRFIQVHGSALILSDGQRIGALLVLNDVTRQKRMEDERRELVANVSHELRTPVAAIRGYLETLENGAIHDPEKAVRFISIASRQTERLSALIEDLLQLAKIEREVESEQVERIQQEIEPILSSCAQTFEPLCEDGTRIEVHCPPELEAEIQEEMLERALANLVSNSLRYGRPGQLISIRAEERSGWIHISVTDEGDGIDREHLSRLFERFYTVDKARSRQKGGTGLGLSIVKHIAKAHRGDVSVTSRKGVGSTFTIRFPAEA
ncbi:MAG: PAS domain-containing protein [Candidatus Eisenbacteria bacterium]|nr:PAS domain-containing protein [Candidatus Eisenbacteria bacterium]